jgi:hypothetical protein
LNKYLRAFLLRWIRLEKKFTPGGDRRNRLTELERGIENINRPYTTQPLQPKWVNEANIEHYVPIDWIQRRIDFLDPAGIPEESREWAKMDRETFLNTANPLTEDEQKWFEMGPKDFLENVVIFEYEHDHPELYK